MSSFHASNNQYGNPLSVLHEILEGKQEQVLLSLYLQLLLTHHSLSMLWMITLSQSRLKCLEMGHSEVTVTTGSKNSKLVWFGSSQDPLQSQIVDLDRISLFLSLRCAAVRFQQVWLQFFSFFASFSVQMFGVYTGVLHMSDHIPTPGAMFRALPRPAPIPFLDLFCKIGPIFI